MLLFASGSLLAADPDLKDELQSVIKKLGQKENYGWRTTNDFGGFISTAEGKANKEGLIQVAVTFGENTTTAYLKGGKGAVKTPEEDWQSLSDLAAAVESEPGPRSFLVRRLQTYKAPAEQAADLASKLKSVKKQDGAYFGELTEEGAKDVLSFGRRRTGNAPEPKNAKGSVRFWSKDGVLTKYQMKLEGTVSFGGEERDLEGSVTVEIKEIGTTKLELPEAAKKKMS